MPHVILAITKAPKLYLILTAPLTSRHTKHNTVSGHLTSVGVPQGVILGRSLSCCELLIGQTPVTMAVVTLRLSGDTPCHL